jgi:hypothetical protein
MSNVTYSFVNPTENDEGLVFESKVSSFGIDHVSKKDLLSFYTNFSSNAYFDSGLLPVDGTGMLSIRTAGNHTQIGYQYAPGMYHINWGAYERDPNAENIYVAQPYRIVIADIMNGNLLGARTFYSPIPVQHAETPLYHVNLPNINCRGYRGNGVGWICLYHTEDISHYPFNEKVVKILERCSGVEAYNDQNMSETDGPRFYRMNNKPTHTWDPKVWETYSQQNGVEWTLDPDLWIPVLVNNIDDQDKHITDGMPLTYVAAILGNYKAYYTDNEILKPVNAIARGQFSDKDVFKIFRKMYNESTDFGQTKTHKNVYDQMKDVREEISKIFVKTPVQIQEEEESDYITCDDCGDDYDPDSESMIQVYEGGLFCSSCIENNTTWVEHLEAYVSDTDALVWSDYTETYYHTGVWNNFLVCQNCGHMHPCDPEAGISPSMAPVYFDEYGQAHCVSCIADKSRCVKCNRYIPEDQDTFSVKTINFEDHKVTVCNACYCTELSNAERNMTLSDTAIVYCKCGRETEYKDMKKFDLKSSFTMPLGCHVGRPSSLYGAIDADLSYSSNIMQYPHYALKDTPSDHITLYLQTTAICPACYENAVELNSWSDMHSQYVAQTANKLYDLFAETKLMKLHGTTINIHPYVL